MSDLDYLTRLVVKFRDDRDWKQFHNIKDMILSLNLESSELLEHCQWKNGSDLEAYVEDQKNEIADELADVFYWVLLIANDLGLSLEQALEAKMVKNNEKYPISKARGNSDKYKK